MGENPKLTFHPQAYVARERMLVRLNEHLIPPYYVRQEFIDLRKKCFPEFEGVEKVNNGSPFVIYYGYTQPLYTRVGTRAEKFFPPLGSYLTRPELLAFNTPVWARYFWITSEELKTQLRIANQEEKYYANFIVPKNSVCADSLLPRSIAKKFSYRKLKVKNKGNKYSAAK